MRILFLSNWFPYPPINGAKIRIYNLIRQLAKQHEISLLSFARTISIEEARAQTPHLGQYCRSVDIVTAKPFTDDSLKARLGFLSPMPRSIFETYSGEMESLVADTVKSRVLDIVLASEGNAPSCVSLLATRIVGIPKVLDAVEVGLAKDVYQSQRSLPGRIRHGMGWMKARRFARQILLSADACTVPSLAEKENVLEIVPSHPSIEVIPHCLDLDYYIGPFGAPEPNSLVFIGSLAYRANLDAACFFLEQVYPRVVKEVPSVTVKIVGNTAGASLAATPVGPNVIFTGFLPDFRATVAEAWCSVVPLRIGAGTRLKIVESMALGTPVVSTSKGAEGLEATNEENILIGDDSDLLAEQIVRVLKNPGLRHTLAANGRRLVKKKYSAEAMGTQFDSLLRSVSKRE